MHSLDDTIAAVSSAAGGATRGIVRISGPAAIGCLQACFLPTSSAAISELKSAQCIPGELLLSLAGDPRPRRLPCDLFLWPGNRSYTRQPVAELHTIGSPPLVEAALRAVCSAGARPAEPGEFTLRAFLAGRIDLLQAEAVLGVIDAGDRRKLDVALAQLAGGLTRPLGVLRDHLLDLLADLEAGLDFAEEDLQFVSSADLDRRLGEAIGSIAAVVAQMQSRSRTDGEPRIALVGWPNVGKSSLFNALVGQSAAIVSPQPGTTRDYLSALLDFGGVGCQLIDTAGVELNAKEGSLSDAAQQMMSAQETNADLRLICVDSTRPLNAWERDEITRPGIKLIVTTKCDDATISDNARLSDLTPSVETSSRTGRGLDQLRSAIAAALSSDRETNPEGTVAETAARCRDSLRLSADCLARARRIAATGRGNEELVAADIRSALTELGKVVGVIYTDDVLDRVFARFCIGK